MGHRMVALRVSAVCPHFLTHYGRAAASGGGCPPPEHKPEAVMSLLKKIFATFRPFYDFRVLVLLAICFGIGMVVDPAATLGLAGYLAYVIGMAGAALMLTKIVMPYLRLSEHVGAALDKGNIAAALVVLARTILLLGILALLVIWGK